MMTPPLHCSSLTIIPTPGVVTSPKSTTLTPTLHSPVDTADFSISPLDRESLPMHTENFLLLPVWLFFKNLPKAQPYSAAIEGVRLSPTMPLIPLILIISFSGISV
jgi:hypothetical protein